MARLDDLLIGIPVCFGLGFLLIWAVDWVNAGFPSTPLVFVYGSAIGA
jgi:hypothetical protein